MKRQCLLCEREFLVTRGINKFCSPRCHNAYKNRKKDGTLHLFNKDDFTSFPRLVRCNGCGKDFLHPRKTMFCSRTCRGRHHKHTIEANKSDRFKKDPKLYLSYKFSEIKNSLSPTRKRANLSTDFTITKEEVLGLWDSQNGKCALTGFNMTHERNCGYMPRNASVDRIDNKKGYIAGNIRLVCRLANQMRFNLTDEEFMVWCHAVVNRWIHANPKISYEKGYMLPRN